MLLSETKILDILTFSTAVNVPEQTNKNDTSKVYPSPASAVSGHFHCVDSFTINCYPAYNNAVYISAKFAASRYPVFVKIRFSIQGSEFIKSLNWIANSNVEVPRTMLFSYTDLEIGAFNLKCEVVFYFYGADELQLALSGKDLVGLRQDVDTDAEIKVEEETIKVHRGFLSTISPVFHAMFKPDTAESKSGIVVIKDLEAAAVVNGIDFCYGHQLTEKSANEIMNVFKFVHKYEVTVAMEKLTSWLLAEANNVCTKYDATKVSTEDIIERIKFAEIYEITALTEKFTKCLVSKMSVNSFWSVAKFAWEKENKALQQGCTTFFQSVDGVNVKLPVNDAIEMCSSEISQHITHENAAAVQTNYLINSLSNTTFCKILMHAHTHKKMRIKKTTPSVFFLLRKA
uniref:BTB domain-containing protein n=1 Tax=Panagrellus redivivus TaxID=6233 RepID=A0A7E4ZWT8_PANRE